MIDDLIISLLLAPLLIPQGAYTRKVTPDLPEPEGPRQGVSGEGSTLKLLILGDSAAAGVGVTTQCDALSGQLVSNLSGDFVLDWRLEAETGVGTAEVIQRLDALEAFDIDIVVVSLGVNDVTSLIALKSWLKFQDQLRLLLVDKFKAKHILLSSIPPMHDFPSLPQPLRWYLGRRSKSFNRALQEQSARFDELEYVPVNFPIKRDFFAEDGFHPSRAAYRIWSQLAAKRIRLKHKR